MRVLVTGGAGFIGSAVCRHAILERGDTVLNIDKLTYAANPRSLDAVAGRQTYSFLQADIRDAARMREALADFRPEAVLHLAAESHVDRSIAHAGVFVETNVGGTHALLEAATDYWSGLPAGQRERFRFLHVSTDEVYGSADNGERFVETTPYRPSSPYAASKAASDHLVRAWHRTYGFPAMISASANNYGLCQAPEKLIPLMILTALDRRALPVYGNGRNVRDWIHVDDNVRGLFAIVEGGRAGESYNVGAGNERANIDVVRLICAMMDARVPDAAPHDRLISFVTDRPGHDLRYATDSGKIESELGWRAEIDFDTGLEATVDWYLDNRTWWRDAHPGGR